MFVVPLLFVGLVLAWLAHRLVWVPGWSVPWLKVVVPLLLVALTGLSFLQFGAGATWFAPDTVRPAVWVGGFWLGVLFYLMLVLPMVALVAWLLGRRDRSGRPDLRRRVHRIAVPATVVLALGVTTYGVLEAADPTLSPRDVTSADLPEAFDGTTVAVITDLHVGPLLGPDFTRRVVDLVNDAEPDLVLIAGDVVDGPEWRYGPAVDPLGDLDAPLGVWAVTGNHELYTETLDDWDRRLRGLGIQTLNNASTPLARGDERIWLLGVHDASGIDPWEPDYDAPVEQVEPDDFALLMAHQPVAATEVDGGLVDLQVSGHTHGGQLWPFRYLVRLQQPMVDGIKAVNGIDVVTSRGAGNWGPPARVGAPPEVPLLTLRRG